MPIRPPRTSRTLSARPRLACCLAAALLLAHSCFARAQTEVEATTIPIALPAGVAYDAQGNLYIALENDHKIIKVDTAGVVTTFAGTGEQGFGGDGGPATSALLDSPLGIAFDSNGSLYVADSHNHRIREIANGNIATVAGTGVPGFSGDTGSATAAQLDRPTAVALDSSNNLYIADSDNHRIRKLTGTTITTVAGDGEQTFSGDGGAATAAAVDTPTGIVFDPTQNGRFYLSDTHNQRVRVVDASGNISTLAGTGTKAFSGDGSAPSAASLARPSGLAADSAGSLYLVDTDNNRVRMITGATITTLAGDGEQGFSGDTGSPTTAVLDTPTAVALNSAGLVSFSDTHNQRARTVESSTVETVAGVAPPTTEGIVLAGALTDTYGTGSVVATFANGTNTASGSATLLDGTVPAGTVSFASNQATFSLATLNAGLHTLAVTYPGDRLNAPTTSGVYLVTISQAAETIDFPQPSTPLVYAPGATLALTATASSGLPVTYTVTGPATVSGSTLTLTGAGTLVITAQAGNQNYTAASVSRTITVNALTLGQLSPATATLGDPAKLVTITGTGFVQNSSILVNGAPVATTYVNGTTLSTTLPASTFLAVQTLTFSVSDPTQNVTSGALPFTVAPAAVSVTLTAPSTSAPNTQPAVYLTLANPYPVPITATLTLTFTPAANGVDDPMIRFTNGTRTETFTLAAGQTTTPQVQFMAGTVSGVIQITPTLSVNGTNVTPANLAPTVVTVPATAPGITALTVTRSGNTLTVTAAGYSDTRETTQAAFHFTAAPGHTLDTTDLTLDVTADFATYYTSAVSDTFGSAFVYAQVFTLNQDASVVGEVTLTLTNSAGTSTAVTAP